MPRSKRKPDKILVSAYHAGRVPAELVWQFLKPDELYETEARYYELDLFDLARVLSVFGILQTKQYPFAQYKNNEAVEALRIAPSLVRT